MTFYTQAELLKRTTDERNQLKAELDQYKSADHVSVPVNSYVFVPDAYANGAEHLCDYCMVEDEGFCPVDFPDINVTTLHCPMFKAAKKESS